MVVLSRPSPPLWIPAFAGMTMVGAGALGKVGWSPMYRGGLASPLSAPLDSGLRRNDDGGGPAVLGRWVGLRWIEEGLPRPSPPLWIPAFAGMTMVGGPE